MTKTNALMINTSVNSAGDVDVDAGYADAAKDVRRCGFGVGSEFSSHLAAGLDWSLAESFSLGGGYRQYYVNYDAGSLDYDYKFGGLYLGLTWRL